MICIHHNKDLDGFSSGAICKFKFPEAKLIGWDYKDPIPDIKEFKGEDVILIDISFPMATMADLADFANSVTWIDHHISAKKEYDTEVEKQPHLKKINYVFELGLAACEIGWKHLFPDLPILYAITLLGRYDTWRKEEGNWKDETLAFQYYMRTICSSPKDFPFWFFEVPSGQLNQYISIGKYIMEYQEQQDFISCKRSSFEKSVFGGLRAICLNTRAFSSDTVKSVYDSDKHDIMIGFEFAGDKWTVSLRSDKEEIDCSLIAKKRGGGGHKFASGFEVSNFEEVFI